MATFPVLYRRGTTLHTPIVGALDNTMAHNPTIRSQYDGGYANTRARFTRIPRRWTVKYDWLSKANALTNTTPIQSIKVFEDAQVGGSAEFTWPNPGDGVSYTVRFLEPVIYTPHPNVNFLWWMAEFILEEV